MVSAVTLALRRTCGGSAVLLQLMDAHHAHVFQGSPWGQSVLDIVRGFALKPYVDVSETRRADVPSRHEACVALLSQDSSVRSWLVAAD